MSAEVVGAQMPTHVTLDDLAVMAAADENHRYELSPEGVLSVVPPADPEHALLVSRLFAWLLTNGYGPDERRGSLAIGSSSATASPRCTGTRSTTRASTSRTRTAHSRCPGC